MNLRRLMGFLSFTEMLLLYMATEAIVRHTPVFVAIHAPGHLQRFVRFPHRFFKVFHRAVTSRTLQPTQLHVAKVREVHMFRNRVHMTPGDRLLLFDIFDNLRLGERFPVHLGVTLGADIQAGDPGATQLVGIRVAVRAFETYVLDMNLMIIGERLFDGSLT